MAIMLELIGAALVSAIIIVRVAQMGGAMSNENVDTNLQVIAQENASTIASMLEYDLYKIGYHDTTQPPIITVADSDRITFKADIDRQNGVDVIRYFTDTTGTGSTSGYKKL